MAKLSRNDDNNPPHARMHEVPQRTDQTVRLGLTALPARYMARGFLKTISDSGTPRIIRKYTSSPIRKWLFEDPLYKRLNAFYSQFDRRDFIRDDVLSDIERNHESLQIDRINKALKTEEGNKIVRQTDLLLRTMDAHEKTMNTVQYAILNGKDGKGGITVTPQSKTAIGHHISGPLFEFFYDNALGIGSLWMTHTIRQRVLNDIRSAYSEVVAYELEKDPSQITDQDIFHSSNRIIQQTSENFHNRQWQRMAMSMIPFIKNIRQVRAMQFGELALGSWGLFWAHDVWGRQPTMLETISDFVNDKLNPRFGIGDPIRPSDIVNLYQQYALKFKPERALRSVGTSDLAEDRLWLQSQGIFREIATLMNESYNYKHVSDIDPETGLPVESVDFRLPKYIYLLGHHLINIHEPDWSMAFVKIANDYDMDAVREVERAYKRGMKLDDILKKYPVDLAHREEEGVNVHVVRDSVAHVPEYGVPKTHLQDEKIRPEHRISTKEVMADHPSRASELAATT